jgi:hypothetical protein
VDCFGGVGNGFLGIGNDFLAVVDDFLGLVNRFGGVGKGFLDVGNHLLAVGNRFFCPVGDADLRPLPRVNDFWPVPFRLKVKGGIG